MNHINSYRKSVTATVLVFQLLLAGILFGQTNDSRPLQGCDTTYQIEAFQPRYPAGDGPRVWIDEAHYNYHTRMGRYCKFSELLEMDGYRVQSSHRLFRPGSLASCDILVIANALNAVNDGVATEKWHQPNPSAFSDGEIAELRRWVAAGGSLLLIADHMPFPAAAEKLGEAFGVKFTNTYVWAGERWDTDLVFRRSDGGLKSHAIIDGYPQSKIDSVRTFLGQGFTIMEGNDWLKPLFVLPAGASADYPVKFRTFDDSTGPHPFGGYLQAAAGKLGKGRVAIFGEAAMFAAQYNRRRGIYMGFGHPRARQNPLFVRNVIAWLAGK